MIPAASEQAQVSWFRGARIYPAGDPWNGQEAQFDQFEPESHDPQDDPPEGSLIWQFDAKGCRVLPYADLAVVELRTRYSADSTCQGDLVYQ